jgi:ribose 1,5-bisphosphokinase
MSWLLDTRRYRASRNDRIGPGRLVLVVGPSGAGKDTLIAGVRADCAHDPSIVFPRRLSTRAATAAEDHDTMSEQMFREATAEGDFALWWDAHGLSYGIPVVINDDIRSGRTVVCNVSRTIVGEARRRYASVSVVLVTAPPDVLAVRLAARGRPSDGDLARRMTRSTPQQEVDADVVIRNVGRPAVGIRRLRDVVRDHGIFIIT